MSQPRAVLSVDLEFFTHTPAYRSATGTVSSPSIGRRGVEFLLDAFADANATGTFFVVSDIADTHPELLTDIVEAGHEIGSHSHTHRHLSTLPVDQRREELTKSKASLESVIDESIVGFRAPSFDVADDHFAMLHSIGYRYDSSVVPSRSIPGWYGGKYDVQYPVRADKLTRGGPGDLSVVPVAVMPGLRVPLTGTWLRFFGVQYALLGMRLLARRSITPVLYVHPWELVDLPAVDGVPARVYWRTGKYMRRAVRRLLGEPFEFVTVERLADELHHGHATQSDTDR